jgi:hypothetical protein
MFKRFAAALSLLVLLSFVAGCGGGGGDDDVSVRPNVNSLQFTGISGEPIPSQSINVELTNASGTVYIALELGDASVANASFNITSSTAAVITVTPAAKPAGTYQTTVFLRVYRNSNGTDLLASFSYPITLTVRPGLSVNPTSLSLNAVQGQTAQTTVAVTLLQGLSGSLSASRTPGLPQADWLTMTVSGNSVQVSASSTSLVPGVYNSEIEIVLPLPNGFTSVRVPVTFTVGVGLVAPPNQTLLLDMKTSLASVSGSVSVARADGSASLWSASSSERWLVIPFPNASGTTPGTLTFTIDPYQVSLLPQFTDSTAWVTITSPSLASVAFSVTLQKRLPYVAIAGPYGPPVGTPARIVVGGAGFSQLNDPMAQVRSAGLNVSSIDVLSDTQLALNATAASPGPFTVGVDNVAGIDTPAAQVAFSAPFAYARATVQHTGGKNIYLHDPVRRAVFALSESRNELVRFQFVNNVWVVTSMPYVGPLNMALSPDGSRIWITDTSNRVAEVSPDSMAVINYYVSGASIQHNRGGVLPISSDGRLWLPGGGRYFDTLTRTFVTLNGPFPFDIDFGSFHGTLDGSLVLVGPSFLFAPSPPYAAYEPVNQQFSNPMGNIDLAYEPRLSIDGSRVLSEFTGQLYNRAFNLLGLVPPAADTDSHFLMTLTPDGNKILVLRRIYTSPSKGTLDSQVIDVYSTTAFAPNSINFAKTGSIPLTEDVSFCNQNFDDCFYGNQYLLPSVDSKTLFWIGNRNMQVLDIP